MTESVLNDGDVDTRSMQKRMQDFSELIANISRGSFFNSCRNRWGSFLHSSSDRCRSLLYRTATANSHPEKNSSVVCG